MNFEIITPNNGYDDEVNPNYTNASKIVAIHVHARLYACPNESEAYTIETAEQRTMHADFNYVITI